MPESPLVAGEVVFVGAGPGAADLITVRGQAALAAADLVVYAGSLVSPALLDHCRPATRCLDSAGLDLPAIASALVEAARAGQRVVRLHTGDPSLYGAIAEQMQALRAAGVPYRVIPGVSAVFAAAAALETELTLPGISQSLILTRRAGRTPVPPGETLPDLARHQTTMALYLSAGEMSGVVADLQAGGYPASTPAAVVFQASWPDQTVLRATLAELPALVAQAGIARQAVIVVGRCLDGLGQPSCLYDPSFTHGYRDGCAQPPPPPQATPAAAPVPPLPAPLAVWTLTASALDLARRLAPGLGATIHAPDRLAGADPQVRTFAAETFAATLSARWKSYAGHICIMAAGIVVRTLVDLVQSKERDPAVVVVDERGRWAIPLLSGHLGGANRLAEAVAAGSGGQAVLTTATDVQGRMAFDALAERLGWQVVDRTAIKQANRLLLEGARLGLALPPALLAAYYDDQRRFVPLTPGQPLPTGLAGLVRLDPDPADPVPAGLPVLDLRRPRLVVGVGCNRGVTQDRLATAIDEVLQRWHYRRTDLAVLATVDRKADEAGLCALAAAWNLPLRCFPAERLAAVAVPNPSAAPLAAVGTPSVAEAAALAAGRGRLIIPKTIIDEAVTVAAAICDGSLP